MHNKCENCGAPNHKTVLRECGWWTEITLPATVWAQNGRFTYEAGTRVELDGATIVTIPQTQFIELPWKVASHAGIPMKSQVCFPNTRQHRYVYIVLSVFESKRLCQWCRFDSDPRFKRPRIAAAGKLHRGEPGLKRVKPRGRRGKK